MHRIYNVNICIGIRQAAQGTHDIFHGLAIIFTAVGCYQNHTPSGIIQLVKGFVPEPELRLNRRMNGIHNGIAAYNHAIRNALCCQIAPVSFCGCKMQLGYLTGQLAVHFLRERGIFVKGTKTGFHMTHRNLVIECCQRTGKGGGGIAMHQNHVRLCLFQHLIQSGQGLGGDGCQRLPRLHDIQIIIRCQAKNIHHLIQHLPMLCCDADNGLHALCPLQLMYQRRHFYRLRPCAEDCHYFDCFHSQILRHYGFCSECS